MTDILAEICEKKRLHVAAMKKRVSLAELTQRAAAQTPPRGFQSALDRRRRAGGIGLIAEVKKASPSKGLIRVDFDPAILAEIYQRAGATCLSVLTDTPYFQGEDAHFTQARAVADLPMIRKDFIVDPYQVLETRALGADCLLLIVAALLDAQMRDIEQAAHEQKMDVLIEIHNEAELDRALTHLTSRLIGINHRNLKTLDVDLAVGTRLAPRIPAGYTKVGESGIAHAKDIARLRQEGIDCFLVGESLMRQPDIEKAVHDLIGHVAQ